MVRAVLFALFIAAPVVADEPKKEPPAFVEQVRTIRKQLDDKLAPIYEKAEKDDAAVKTEADREKVMVAVRAESGKVIAPAVRKVYEAVKPFAEDPAACELLVWLVQHEMQGETGIAAVELLMKHHLVRKETIELAKNMKRAGSGWVEGMLRAQLASADLPKEQTWRVTLSLAMCLQGQAELPSRLADAPEPELKQFDLIYGKERVAEMKKYDPAKLEAEAVKLFAEVGEKYPKQEIIPGLTVGEVAKSSVFEIEHLGIGKVAPDIAGEDLDGVKFKLSDSRGKVVMLSFWASWCGPCMGLVPHERELVDQYKGKPFELIGVNGDPDKKDLKKVLTDNKITWRSFWAGEKGPEGPIPMAWNVGGWPTIYLIDEKGVIRSKTAIGNTLDAKIEKLVVAAEKANGKK